jgi:hypothetical protein
MYKNYKSKNQREREKILSNSRALERGGGRGRGKARGNARGREARASFGRAKHASGMYVSHISLGLVILMAFRDPRSALQQTSCRKRRKRRKLHFASFQRFCNKPLRHNCSYTILVSPNKDRDWLRTRFWVTISAASGPSSCGKI